MLSSITVTVWKLVLLGALSAFAGSAITITIIKTSEPAPVECPVIKEPSDMGTDTFRHVSPQNSARRYKGF